MSYNFRLTIFLQNTCQFRTQKITIAKKKYIQPSVEWITKEEKLMKDIASPTYNGND